MPPSTESEETDPSFACGAANVVSGDALRSGEDRRIEDGCRRRPGLVANCSALADTECVALRPISPHGFLRDSPLPQVQLQVSARRLLSPGAMWFGFVPRRLSLTSLLAAHRCPSAQIAPHCVSGSFTIGHSVYTPDRLAGLAKMMTLVPLHASGFLFADLLVKHLGEGGSVFVCYKLPTPTIPQKYLLRRFRAGPLC